MMETKTVVLDGYTLNPGDLSWEPLTDLGRCEIYERTAAHETSPAPGGPPPLLTNKVVLDRETHRPVARPALHRDPATGINVVDLAAARARGITVTNVPAYSTPSVVQMTFALLLELTQRVGHHAGSVRAGNWVRSKDFSYWDFPLVELSGLTMGCRFRRDCAGRGEGGAGVWHDRLATRRGDRPPEVPGVEMVDVDTLFARSDVLSVHCPLTPETKGIVNAARLATMKPTAYVLNTSRGPIIDEADLAAALDAGPLPGRAWTCSRPNRRPRTTRFDGEELFRHAAYRVGDARGAWSVAGHRGGEPARISRGTPRNVVS